MGIAIAEYYLKQNYNLPYQKETKEQLEFFAEDLGQLKLDKNIKDFGGFECVGLSEYDLHPSAVLAHRFPNIKNYGDITKVRTEDVPDIDMLVGGFPCVMAGTLITTDRGLVPIEEVRKGDMALTHKNRWRKVVATMNQPSDHYYEVSTQGSPSLQITGHHPLYCKKMIRAYNDELRTAERIFSQPNWLRTDDLREDDMVGFGTWSDKHCNNPKNLTAVECWLIGRFVADGYTNKAQRKARKSSNHNTVWTIGKTKFEEFENKIKESDLKFSAYEDRTAVRVNSCNQRMFDLCSDCGKGAHNKKVPHWIMNLQTNKLKHFMDGYMSGDGSISPQGFKASTVSRVLVYQLGQIVHRLYKTPYTISLHTPEPTKVIEGRTVNQRPVWQIGFDKKSHKQDNSVWQNNNIWGRYKSKCRVEGPCRVYNIEVEEDHSYVANNLIVKNCQDYSLAGKRAGIEGFRGQLVYELFRIMKEKQPKICLFENVQGLLSQDNGRDFEIILERITELGYAVDFDVLNTKFFGLPQNRARVMIVAKRLDLLKEDEVV